MAYGAQTRIGPPAMLSPTGLFPVIVNSVLLEEIDGSVWYTSYHHLPSDCYIPYNVIHYTNHYILSWDIYIYTPYNDPYNDI